MKKELEIIGFFSMTVVFKKRRLDEQKNMFGIFRQIKIKKNQTTFSFHKLKTMSIQKQAVFNSSLINLTQLALRKDE
jgi:hypothetical protein